MSEAEAVCFVAALSEKRLPKVSTDCRTRGRLTAGDELLSFGAEKLPQNGRNWHCGSAMCM